MPKVLTGRHAEDVGNGLVVEPGHVIPDGADEEIVARLETDGRLYESSPKAEHKKQPTAKSEPKSEPKEAA